MKDPLNPPPSLLPRVLLLSCTCISGCTSTHTYKIESGGSPELRVESTTSLLPHGSGSRSLYFNGKKFRNFRSDGVVRVPQLNLWVFVTSSWGSDTPCWIHVVPDGDVKKEFSIKTELDFGGNFGTDRSMDGACFLDRVDGRKIWFRYAKNSDPLGDGVIPPDSLYLLDLDNRTFARIK